ncbi:MAG: T9SS type A sorting domain-containing protein [Saprospiraceae bacterium]|nr:T9SS type A sorting domain-containing protein [Saprospiraceae bacterium]
MSGITRTIIIVLGLLNHTVGYSQRYDFNWVFGYDGGKGDPRFGTTLVDFNSGNPMVSFAPQGKMVIFEANASISDKEGNLLYYTNGYDVEDANFKKVLGATNLGIQYWDGLHEPQGVLFLNNPNSDSSYYLFYINIVLNSPHFHVLDLNYLLIDKFSEKVINKGNVVHDTINSGCLTACKHANGRDYWIILNKENTNLFYKYLLTSEGIILISSQNIGPNIKEGYGQVVFSPNGEYFALLDAIDFRQGLYIKLYKFDRCTGEIEFIRMDNYPTSSFSGISFSPNSRYLYYSEQKNLYQMDLENLQSFDSPELIDTIESQTQWGSQYNLHQLGPDGRIYISNAYSNFAMHRINKPNEPGKACIPRSNSFALKTLGGYGIPNMPNYRLGPLDGSLCDTLGIDNIPWAWWRHDQDTTDYLNFEFTDLSAYEVTEWEWRFGDGMTSNSQSPIHRYSKNGIYEVCMIAKNKNGADTLCKILNIGTTTTIDDQDQIKIEIFPNPCKDYFILNVLDYNPEKMFLYLYDVNGNLILTKRLYAGSNEIELNSISNGVYIVKIMEQRIEVKCEKLVKF